MKAILVPVKDPANAKTRLSTLLTAGERQGLAVAMFEDVLSSLAGVTKADGIFIVTSFLDAAGRAKDMGFETILEERQVSESASVDAASIQLAELGFDVVMRLPADIPLVRADDVDGLLASDLGAPATVMVPSHDGTGTNCLIRTPGPLFPSRFGPNSLALHKEEAARVGSRVAVIDNERIGLDIDDQSDIERFLQLGQGTGAFQFLRELGLAKRLPCR
ncbi:MAG TPA: 2-phospho-L-lactate guanylyltransferase [Blastocatellia bacterium]|nr:2-phospho-L-lactate guanylyltransferase [Blastocatellia bacterium]